MMAKHCSVMPASVSTCSLTHTTAGWSPHELPVCRCTETPYAGFVSYASPMLASVALSGAG